MPTGIQQFSKVQKFVQEQQKQGASLNVSNVVCENCFTQVAELLCADSSLLRYCACYVRFYVADNPECHAPLSDAYWRDLRAASYAKDPVSHKMIDALERHGQDIVNRSVSPNYDCWCPGCQRNRKVAYQCPWFTRDKITLICVYGACAQCGSVMAQLSETECSKFLERIELRLVERYPSLTKRLPADYFSADKDEP